jgi:hypothetical protein
MCKIPEKVENWQWFFRLMFCSLWFACSLAFFLLLVNPQIKQEAIALAQGIAKSITPSSPSESVGLFVPFPFLSTVQEILGNKSNCNEEQTRTATVSRGA